MSFVVAFSDELVGLSRLVTFLFLHELSGFVLVSDPTMQMRWEVAASDTRYHRLALPCKAADGMMRSGYEHQAPEYRYVQMHDCSLRCGTNI